MWDRKYEGTCTGLGDWGARNRTIETAWKQVPCITTLAKHRADSGKNQIPAEDPGSLYFLYIPLHFGTYRWGNTKIPLEPASTSTGPFKCLVWIINWLMMRGGRYEAACTGWGDWGVAAIATSWNQAPCIPTLNQHRPESGRNQIPAGDP